MIPLITMNLCSIITTVSGSGLFLDCGKYFCWTAVIRMEATMEHITLPYCKRLEVSPLFFNANL